MVGAAHALLADSGILDLESHVGLGMGVGAGACVMRLGVGGGLCGQQGWKGYISTQCG